MRNPYFILNEKKFYYDQIKEGHFNDLKLSAYEKSTLLFCHQWLNGKSTFSIPTSGSTGKPKSIEVSREQMVASAKMTAGALGLQSGDHALVCLNTDYIAGKMMLARGFVIGMQMTIISSIANPLKSLAINSSIDFTALVPLQLQTILENETEKLKILNRLKAIIIGGAAVSTLLQKMLQKLSCPVYSTYGMTETVSHIALRRLNGKENSAIYTVFDEVEIDQDHRGCLTIQSVLTGHQTLITNDVVEIKSPKTFRWLGRIDNVINSGGVKIQIEQVEAEISNIFEKLGDERRFFIAGIKDDRLGEKIVLIIEGEPLSEPGKKKTEELLASHLQKYAVPKSFYFLPRFLETETGKINRKETLKNVL